MNTARRTSATILLVAALAVVVGAAVGRAHAAPVASAGAAADAGKLVVPRGQPLQIAFVNDLTGAASRARLTGRDVGPGSRSGATTRREGRLGVGEAGPR